MGRESRAIAAGHALDTTLDRFEGIYADVTGRIVPLGRAA
jgi:hypothetical protein